MQGQLSEQRLRKKIAGWYSGLVHEYMLVNCILNVLHVQKRPRTKAALLIPAMDQASSRNLAFLNPRIVDTKAQAKQGVPK